MKPLPASLLPWLFGLGLTALASAQTAGPAPAPAADQTELILPDVLVRVEDLGVEKIEGVFNRRLDLPTPDLAVPLPDRGQLAVPEVALPLPSGGLPSFPGAQPAAGQESFPVYSKGQVGAGSSSFIHGSLNLLKLGRDPRFSLDFLHEADDGYWDGTSWRPAGTWTSARRDQLKLEIQARLDQAELKTSASYLETETGFQGLSTAGLASATGYQTALLRRWNVAGDWRLPLGTAQEFSLKAAAASAVRVFTGPMPLSQTEAQPSAGLQWRLFWAADNDLTLGGRWNGQFRGQSPLDPATNRQDLEADARLRLILLPGWSLSVLAGGGWTTAQAWTWNLNGETVYQQKTWDLGLKGSWQRRLLALSGLWDLSSKAVWTVNRTMDQVLPTDVLGGTWLNWRPASAWSLKAALDWTWNQDKPGLGPYQSGNAAVPVLLTTAQTWQPQLAVTWVPLSGLTLTADWQGEFPSAENTFGLKSAWTATDDVWGAEFSGQWTPDAQQTAAKLDAGVHWNLLKSLRLEGRLSDPLSLLMKGGRLAEDGTLEPGFSLRFFTRITL